MKVYSTTEIKELCNQDREIEFYWSRSWKAKRDEVFRLDHYECQRCKEQGIYTPAQTVHHVKHLKDRPDLAYDIWYKGERQLISLCNSCHNKEHPEKLKKVSLDKPLTDEKW